VPSVAPKHPVAVPQTAGAVPVLTEVVAVIVVNAPVFGVVLPIVPGATQVFPSNCETFRFGTTVVLVIENGAVPVASVDVNCPGMLKLPGSVIELGSESVQVPVLVTVHVPEAVISLEVPATVMLVTEPEPPPPEVEVTAWLGFRVAVAVPDEYAEQRMRTKEYPPAEICQVPADVVEVTPVPPEGVA
jgi:hypothetical protein